MNYPKISIVTPNFNQAKYLEETIQSVVSQGYPNLEYIVIDGGSTDGSVDIIKKYLPALTYWVSEPDKGLYHALEKGFRQTTGEIMGYLNSDDLLHRKSLFTISKIFSDLPSLHWVQGRPTVYNEAGLTVDSHIPIYSKYHFYLKKYTGGQFIQQESTYWRRYLWEKAGGFISTQYKYAGDFDLWMRFYKHEILQYTHALIGGYRVRKTQLSRSFFKEYLEECNSIIDSAELTASERKKIARIKWLEHNLSNRRFVRNLFKDYVRNYYELQPPVSFDFKEEKFCK